MIISRISRFILRCTVEEVFFSPFGYITALFQKDNFISLNLKNKTVRTNNIIYKCDDNFTKVVTKPVHRGWF